MIYLGKGMVLSIKDPEADQLARRHCQVSEAVHSGWLKEFLSGVALLIMSLAVFLLLGEFTARTLLRDKIVLFPRYHTAAHYGDFTLRTVRPHSTFWHTSVDGSWRFVTNSAGFRDTRDFSYRKPQGVLRVVSLGDSHTQGFEVRQKFTFSAVLEHELERNKVQSEVINTGVSGFGTAEELILLENEIIKYQPDFVILAFYANDFKDNVKSDLFVLKDSQLVQSRKIHVPGVAIQDFIYQFALIRWLSENSYLYSWTFNTVWESAKQLLLTTRRAELETEHVQLAGDVTDYELELAVVLIRQTYEFCRRHAIGLLIVDIPQPSLDGRLRSSIPLSIREEIAASADVALFAEEVFDGRPTGALHLPHGQRHISELAHRALGVQISHALMRWLGRRRAAPEAAASSQLGVPIGPER